MKPQLWVKSYPYPKEVQALADLGAQNVGMELFLGGNTDKNEECIRICNDNYPRLGIELFCYQDEEKGKGEIIYNPLSTDQAVKQLSRNYLFGALELAIKYGATHLQLDGNDGYIARPGQIITAATITEAIERKKSLLTEIAERFDNFPVYFENTFPIDDHAPEFIFSVTGHRLSDFYEKGLPLEYDVAHHAVALDIYNRADQFNFPLTNEEIQLAEKVRQVGITAVILEDLQKIPQIYFTQLSNATPFALLHKPDTPAEDSSGLMVDLEAVLPTLMTKSLNITPEVADKDYVQRPNLRNWITMLQEF